MTLVRCHVDPCVELIDKQNIDSRLDPKSTVDIVGVPVLVLAVNGVISRVRARVGASLVRAQIRVAPSLKDSHELRPHLLVSNLALVPCSLRLSSQAVFRIGFGHVLGPGHPVHVLKAAQKMDTSQLPVQSRDGGGDPHKVESQGRDRDEGLDSRRRQPSVACERRFGRLQEVARLEQHVCCQLVSHVLFQQWSQELRVGRLCHRLFYWCGGGCVSRHLDVVVSWYRWLQGYSTCGQCVCVRVCVCVYFTRMCVPFVVLWCYGVVAPVTLVSGYPPPIYISLVSTCA